jgi:5'-deoxynucleotidase YfbR-like HD superfamily hydrolase
MRDYSLAVQHSSDCQLLFARKARGLAHLRRWNGACDVTVAQHCVMACDHVSRRAAPYALIHDIEEDETGDLLTPVKQPGSVTSFFSVPVSG